MTKVGERVGSAAVGAAVGMQAFRLVPHCDQRWLWRMEQYNFIVSGVEVRLLMVAWSLSTILGAATFAVAWWLATRRRTHADPPGQIAATSARRRYFVWSQCGAAMVAAWGLLTLIVPLAGAMTMEAVSDTLLWLLALNAIIATLVAARRPPLRAARTLLSVYLVLAVLLLPQAYHEYFPAAYYPFRDRCDFDYGVANFDFLL